MSSLANRRIVLGAGALFLLGLAAPLSAQQPAKQQADTSCIVQGAQVAMRDTAMHHRDTTIGRMYDSVPKPAAEKAGDNVAKECQNAPAVPKGDTLKKPDNPSPPPGY